MTQAVVFIALVVILLAVVWMTRRTWRAYVRLTPEDEAFDATLASLNDDQANRVSDDQLLHSLSTDEAWRRMAQDGSAKPRRERKPRRRALHR